MQYSIEYTDQAQRDLARLLRDDPKAFRKVEALVHELAIHPMSGTGHPEPLKGDRSGQWSRRITKKHRLVYLVNDDVVTVLVLSSYGHYDDR